MVKRKRTAIHTDRTSSTKNTKQDSQTNQNGSTVRHQEKKRKKNTKSTFHSSSPKDPVSGHSNNKTTTTTTTTTTDEEPWSKSKKKRMRRLLHKPKPNQDTPQFNHSLSNTKSKIATTMTTKNATLHQDTRKKPSATNEHYENETKMDLNSNSNLDPIPTNKKHPSNTTSTSTSKLQQSFLERLSGSRFRILNEELYTTTSTTSHERFTAHPNLFEEYHQGFRQQVQAWPVNPLDLIYDWIVSYPLKKKIQSQKNTTTNTSSKSTDKTHNNFVDSNLVVVADFGCGDAKLAERLLAHNTKQEQALQPNKKTGENHHSSSSSSSLRFQVHSFDFLSNNNPLITPCDMAHTHLTHQSVDVAVFCLALMGTNMVDFIREAYRVLRPDGILKVAEVRSRFEKGSHSNGSLNSQRDETLLEDFLSKMMKLGFQCTQKNQSNRMFLLLDFVKVDPPPWNSMDEKEEDITFHVKPCIYKRR